MTEQEPGTRRVVTGHDGISWVVCTSQRPDGVACLNVTNDTDFDWVALPIADLPALLAAIRQVCPEADPVYAAMGKMVALYHEYEAVPYDTETGKYVEPVLGKAFAFDDALLELIALYEQVVPS